MSQPSQPIPPGTVIEQRYVVQEQLGEGGFARIYRARHVFLKRDVVLKVLDPEAFDEPLEHLEVRFLREAQTAAQLQHPNIVHIYDFGFYSQDRRPFIVMERLHGLDLFDVLNRRGALPPSEAIALFIPALEGLARAHQAGIVHRDLKPTNLFLHTTTTGDTRLVLLDFGIAALLDVPEASDRPVRGGSEKRRKRLTGSGQILGTPQYTAPEYIESSLITPALDVYQMGIILTEMLLGAPVIDETNPHLAFHRHLSADLALPETLMRGPLGPIVERALARDPAQRYSDAGALREALLALRDTPIPSPLPSSAPPPVPPPSSQPTHIQPLKQATPCVLVVDADPGQRSCLARLLEAGEHETLLCDVWEGASEYLWRRPRIALVIIALEEMMRRPALTPLICAELHNRRCPVLVILPQGTPTPVVELEASKLDYHTLLMPQDNEAIVSAINRLSEQPLAHLPESAAATPSTPGTHLPERAWVGWLYGMPLTRVTPAPRIAIPMPSLSSGELHELPLPRLAYLFSIQRRTGRLTLKRDRRECVIEISRGRLEDTPEVRAAFAWTQGQYHFKSRTPDPKDYSASPAEDELLSFLYEGITQHMSFNDIAAQLAPHSHHYPHTTTQLAERRISLTFLDQLYDVLERCDGSTTLTQLLAKRILPFEAMFHALAFGLLTDTIVFLDAPSTPPVSVTYALRKPNPDELAALEEDSGTFAQIARLTPTDKHILDQLQELNTHFQRANPYDVFGLTPGCGGDAVRFAFYRLASTHHPQHYQIYEGTFVQVVADLVFKQLQDMSHVLLAQEEAPTRPEEVVSEEAAERFAAGVDRLKAKDISGAFEHFRTASKQAPHHPEYLAYRGWCLFLLQPEKAAMSRAMLEKAKALDCTKDMLLFLIRICRHQSDHDAALAYAREAAERYPRSKMVRAELAKLERS